VQRDDFTSFIATNAQYFNTTIDTVMHQAL